VAKPIYTAISSLDGYGADEKGEFDWSEPEEEVHRFVNDLERDVGTHLYGLGKQSLPDGVRAQLELPDERRFDNGVGFLDYRAVT
jgi:hypothetical protein